jgi:hypothetical protein
MNKKFPQIKGERVTAADGEANSEIEICIQRLYLQRSQDQHLYASE